MKTIRFTTDKLPYTFGQIVQFKNDIADALIQQRVAVLYTPASLPPPPPPPQGQPLSSTTPIAGNPAGYQTPGQIAQKLNTLETKLSDWDKNQDEHLDPDRLETREYPFAAAQSTWSIAHNYGRFPVFTLFDLAGNALEEPVRQDPSPNTTIFTWLVPQAGKAVG